MAKKEKDEQEKAPKLMVESAAESENAEVAKAAAKPEKQAKAEDAEAGHNPAEAKREEEKPSLQEVREFVLGVIDRQTDGKIQSGLIWHCRATDEYIPVWLSKENQMNFKAAYDLAVQKQGTTLPVTFKMGEIDGTPVYHTFGTMEDAEDFYTTAVDYIHQCLTDGWRKKDNFDFTPYEEALNV